MRSGWGCIVMVLWGGGKLAMALILDGMYNYKLLGRKMYGNGRNLICTSSNLMRVIVYFETTSL